MLDDIISLLEFVVVLCSRIHMGAFYSGHMLVLSGNDFYSFLPVDGADRDF